MNITTSAPEYCRLCAHVELDKESVASLRKSTIAEVGKTVTLPGFRPGKASPAAVLNRYKKEIDAKISASLFQDAFNAVVKANGLKPMGQPSIDSVKLVDDSFVCDFTIHHKPTFELNQYKGLEIPKPVPQISATDLTQNILQKLRLQNGEYADFTDQDKVESNDSIVIDYSTSLDGVVQSEISGKNISMSLTGNSPFPEFHNNILGMILNEERVFDALVPEVSSLPTYSGKKLNFTVKLIGGQKFTPAALNDDLATKIGLKDFNDLMSNVNSVSTKRVEEYVSQAISDQIAARLIESHSFEVPSWLIAADAKIQAHGEKLNWDHLSDEVKSNLSNSSEKSLKLSLILEKICEIEPEACISNDEAMEVLKSQLPEIVSSTSQEDVEKAIKSLSDGGMLGMLISKIQNQYTLDFLVKTVTITE